MSAVTPSGSRIAPAFAATIVLASLALWELSVPAGVIARFWLLVFFGFFLPGRLLSPKALAGTEALATALVIGVSLAGLLWAATLLAGASGRWAAGAMALLSILAIRRGAWRVKMERRLFGSAVLVLCTAAVAWTQLGNGLSRSSPDLTLFSTYPPEALFHCAISQELRHSLPIHFPAGATFSYHVLYNLLAALTTYLTGGSMLDVHYRLLPLLLVPMAVVSAFAFARSIGASPGAAGLGALFLFFADDLSWLLALSGRGNFRLAGGPEWNFLLATPIVYGLHHNRAFLAGLSVFFVALLLAARALREGDRRTLWTAAGLIAVSTQYKVSFGLLLLAGVAMTAAFAWSKGSVEALQVRRRALVLLALSTSLAAPLFLYVASAYRAGSVPLVPFPGYPIFLTLLRSGFFPDTESLKHAFREAPVLFTLRWGLMGGALYTLGTLGVRALGIIPLWRWSRSEDPLPLLTAGVVIAGYLASLLLATPPARGNTIYFWGTSLCILSVLSGVEAAGWMQRGSFQRRMVGAVLLIALGLPSAVQMLGVDRSFATKPFLRFSSGEVAAINALAAKATPGEVILEPVVYYSLFSAMIPVRPVLSWPQWLRNVIGEEQVRQRRSDVRMFFSSRDPGRMREILNLYDVSWIWLPRSTDRVSNLPLPELRLEFASEAGQLYRMPPR